MDLPEREITFTIPQALFARSRHKQSSLEWGRGGGKSTVLGYRMKDVVNHLPRAKFGIVGSNYAQILSRTLPSTIEGLELLGFKKDLHYFVGRRPPKEWRWQEAYQPPLTYDNYISFYNGTGFQMISLENGDGGRGLNLDGCIGDEAALFNKDKLDNNVLLCIRGNLHRFSHHWLHQSHLFTSTTPVSVTGDGRWFIDLEEEARKNPKEVMHMIAKSAFNFENLGANYFKMLRRKLTPLAYSTEVDCIRPGRVQNGFYPKFSSLIHTYMSSNDNYVFGLNYDLEALRKVHSSFYGDVNPNQYLEIAFDYGAAINTLVVGQLHGEVFRIPKAMHVKSPDTVLTLAQEFCDYFRNHINKEVHYHYDHTAHYRDAVRTTSFADEIEAVLRKNGWNVVMHYHGQAPLHLTKFAHMEKVLGEKESNYPRIRINSLACEHLIISIEQAGAYDGPKGIQKDKRPEKRKNVVDEETTHYSDAFDTLVFFRFKNGLNQDSYLVQRVA
jgi:hypothetical protein